MLKSFRARKYIAAALLVLGEQPMKKSTFWVIGHRPCVQRARPTSNFFSSAPPPSPAPWHAGVHRGLIRPYEPSILPKSHSPSRHPAPRRPDANAALRGDPHSIIKRRRGQRDRLAGRHDARRRGLEEWAARLRDAAIRMEPRRDGSAEFV